MRPVDQRQPDQSGDCNVAKNVDIRTVHESMRNLWYIASCMKHGGNELLKLGSTGKSGITRAELQDLEHNCFSRETVGDVDPPLYVYLSRSQSGKARLSVMRWSQSKNEWEVAFSLSGSPANLEGEMSSTDEAYLLPVLDKLASVRENIVNHITQKKPNDVLWRSYFDTYPKDAFWMQMTSPQAPETRSGLTYRLYVNPEIKNTDHYYNMVQKIIKISREHNEPINFKFMYSGDQAETVIKNPDSTKIVFYFKDKQSAIRFADYLASELKNEDEVKAAKIPINERYEPQRTWEDGLLALGKGTREERRDVRQRIGNNMDVGDVNTWVRHAIDDARALSMTI